MKGSDLIRYAVVLATLAYLFGGEDGPRPPKPEPCVVVPDYNGPLMALSNAGKEMEPDDRRWLSDAFLSAGAMVANDSQELIKSTSQQQDIVLATLTFDYGGQYVPQKKYASVSAEVEKQMIECIGTEVKSVTPSDNLKFADCLKEMGKALQ